MRKVQDLKSIIENTAIHSWSWYHFIFFFFVIPLVILLIPILGLSEIFQLDLCHPTLLLLYTNNFVHKTLPHLANNLIAYLIFMMGIFFLEKEKLRFRNMVIFLFFILPFLGSALYTGFLGKVCAFKTSLFSFGFSAITLGIIGYFVYLLLLSSIPLFFKIIEENFYKTTFKRIVSVELIVFINFIIFCMVDAFGIVVGMFSLVDRTTANNGFVHSVSFVSGILLPMILELRRENKLDNFHTTLFIHIEGLIIFLTAYLVFFYLKI